MGRAVDLNDQFFVPTNEVGKVGSDRLLADEFYPVEAAPAQRSPHHGLGVRLAPAQDPRSASLKNSTAAHYSARP